MAKQVQFVTRGRGAVLLYREATTGYSNDFWKRRGITPVLIGGRWYIALADIERIRRDAGLDGATDDA